MYVEHRKRFVEWLRRQLIGPSSGLSQVGPPSDLSLRVSPLDRYPTGVLHPVDPGVSGIDPASPAREEPEPTFLDEEDDADGENGADDEEDDRKRAQPVLRRLALNLARMTKTGRLGPCAENSREPDGTAATH